MPRSSLPSLAPVVVTGAHRSGTTAVARALEALGLFLGADLDANHESVWFRSLSDRLLTRCHGGWDRPEPLRAMLRDPDALGLTLACLEGDLSDRGLGPYLGRGLFAPRPERPARWGWKDPRCVFTLPCFEALFPELRVVYVVRHPLDVARSLVRRERAQLERRLAGLPAQRARRSRRSLLERAAYKGAARCLCLADALGLWRETAAEGERLCARVGQRALLVRFEDLLEEPTACLGRLAEFCRLPCDAAATRAAAAHLDPSRAYPHRRDPEAARHAETLRADASLLRLGYAPAE